MWTFSSDELFRRALHFGSISREVDRRLLHLAEQGPHRPAGQIQGFQQQFACVNINLLEPRRSTPESRVRSGGDIKRKMRVLRHVLDI